LVVDAVGVLVECVDNARLMGAGERGVRGDA
jgi:hypothetical protein